VFAFFTNAADQQAGGQCGTGNHFDFHNSSFFKCALLIVKNSDFAIKQHLNERSMNGA